MAEGTRIFVRDRAGERYSIPEGEAPGLFADPLRGFRLETPEEAQEAELQAKYGSSGQEILAGIEGAGRGLTLGLSTPLERALGVPAEDIAGREAANPTAALVGEGIGTAAPIIATLGATAPAQAGVRGAVAGAAKLTAPSIISRVGRAAELGTQALLPAGEGILAKMVARGLAAGAGAATEGALYGVGHVIHEAALGDPEFTAQSALAEIGTSAALMGGLGFLGGAASKGLGVALEKARGALGRASEAIQGAFPGKERFAKAVEEQYAATEKALREANRVWRPEETAHYALANVPPTVAQEAYAGVVDKASRLATMMREAPELYPARFPKRLEDWATALVRDSGDVARSPAKAFRAIDDFKGVLDDLIKFDKLPSEETREALNAIKGLRAEVRAGLENEAVWGAAGARQAAFNGAQAEYLTARKNFEKFFTTRLSGTGGPTRRINPSALEQLGQRADDASMAIRREAFDRYNEATKTLVEQLQKTAETAPFGAFNRKAVERLIEQTGETFRGVQRQAAVEQTANMISGGLGLVGSIGTGGLLGGPVGAGLGAGLHLAATGAKYLPKAAEVLGRLQKGNAALTKQIERASDAIISGTRTSLAAGRSALATAEGYEERATRVRELALAPERMQEALERMTDGLHEHAPATAQAAQVAAARAVTFLASKLPAAEKQGPLGPTLSPSREQRTIFGRYYEGVEAPLSILDRVSDATLTKEHMEALATVHPKLLAQMRATVLERVANHKGAIPRQARLALSKFLGQPLDLSLTPKSIARTQAVYQMPSLRPDAAPMPRPTAAGAGKLTLSSRTNTALDSGANRSSDQ